MKKISVFPVRTGAVRLPVLPGGILLGAVLITLLILGLTSCNVVPQGEAMVSPNMVFPASSRALGLNDFVSDVRLSITGGGIDQEWSLSQGVEELEITLPAANNVRFELEASLGSLLNTGPVLSLGGALQADLVAGETTNLDFYMGPYETKILVPDYNNFRIVQVEDLSITEENPASPQWEELDLSSTYFTTSNDVAIDNFGQIWIGCEGEYNGIIATGTIGTDSVLIPAPSFSPVYALAFEKKTGYMYYIYDAGIVSSLISVNRIDTGSLSLDNLSSYVPNSTNDLNINTLVELNSNNIGKIYSFGLEVDNEGYVYFTGQELTPQQEMIDCLYKVNPATAEIVAQTSGNDITFLTDALYTYDYPDILFKNGYIYVTNQYGADGEKILKFNTDLELVDSFGSAYTDGATTGQFYGPSRFLATSNKKIYVIDELPYSDGIDENRIVSFSDTDGSGWETYQPQTTEGSDMFEFFQTEILY